MPVILRALAPEHVPIVISACADWQELSGHGPPYWRPRSPAELTRKIAATAGPELAGDYTFVLDDESRLVGECSLHGIDWRNRVAQIGVCIWNPADRRHGYGRAGIQQLISWAVEHLDLARLEAWILADNQPSLALFRSLGFTTEGTMRDRYLQARRRHDVVVMGWTATPEPTV